MSEPWRPPDDFTKPRNASLVQALAEGIVSVRTRAGHTAESFARLLSWSRPWLDEIECGTREARVADLERICAVLDVPLADLLRGTARGRQAARTFGILLD